MAYDKYEAKEIEYVGNTEAEIEKLLNSDKVEDQEKGKELRRKLELTHFRYTSFQKGGVLNRVLQWGLNNRKAMGG